MTILEMASTVTHLTRELQREAWTMWKLVCGPSYTCAVIGKDGAAIKVLSPEYKSK